MNFWTSRINQTASHIKNFFNIGITGKIPFFNQFENSPAYESYQLNLENYVKLVWLTREYVANSYQFKYPLGMNWNYYKQKWNLHPGGARNIVLYFMLSKKATGIIYDERNSIDLKPIFYSVRDIKDYFKTEEIFVASQKEEGRIVPHVHIESRIIYPNIQKEFETVKDFYETTSINANFNLLEFGYKNPPAKNVKKRVTVRITDPKNKEQAIRALLLMPSQKKINYADVRIIEE